MEYKPTYKKPRVTNKDKLRIKKYSGKWKHNKKVKVKLNKLEKRKEKEKYMRNDRKYWDYFVDDILQHSYMYKLKDSVIDWLHNDELFSDMTESAFWDHICENPHSTFMLFDRKHIRYLTGQFQENYITLNKNADIICELIVIEMLKNVKEYECLRIWGCICRYGGPRTIRLLEDNVDKYREAYGEHYTYLYESLCKNPNAMHLIHKYYDTMFNEGCHWYILENPHTEAVDIVERIFDNINEYTIMRQTPAIMKNTGAIRIIKRVLEMDRPFAAYHLMENENAVDIIQQLIVSGSHVVEWTKILKNPSAINIILDYPENINYYHLCSNKNAVCLLEDHMNNIMADELDDSHFLHQYFYEDPGYDIDAYGLCENVNAFHLVEKYPDFLATNVLSNPRIFEINYDYLRRKWDYVTHEEESRMIKFMKKEITHIEPRLLKKLHTDYISQAEIETVVNEYAEKDKYLPEHELIFRISYERLIRAVYSPRRVFYNLTMYNYDIHNETYGADEMF